MFYGRKFIRKPNLSNDDSSKFSPGPKEELLDSSEDCHLVVSATGSNPDDCWHYPVIDLDVPVNLVQSSRIGHTHLYINKPVTKEGMLEILEVLAKHCIVEQGYYEAAKSKGYSAVRLPWVKKDAHIQ